MTVRRSTVVGAVGGLIIAGVIVLLAWLNDVLIASDFLQTAINFFASLPALVFAVWFNLPELLQYILYFAYWALIGGALGWLVSQKQLIFKAAALVLVVGLVILHRLAQVKLERELTEAMEALGEAFSILFKSFTA